MTVEKSIDTFRDFIAEVNNLESLVSLRATTDDKIALGIKIIQAVMRASNSRVTCWEKITKTHGTDIKDVIRKGNITSKEICAVVGVLHFIQAELKFREICGNGEIVEIKTINKEELVTA